MGKFVFFLYALLIACIIVITEANNFGDSDSIGSNGLFTNVHSPYRQRSFNYPFGGRNDPFNAAVGFHTALSRRNVRSARSGLGHRGKRINAKKTADSSKKKDDESSKKEKHATTTPIPYGDNFNYWDKW